MEKEFLNGILLGIIINGDNPDQALKEVNDLGFTTCQVDVTTYSGELAQQLKNAFLKYKLKPNTLLCLGPGEQEWNFTEGPATVGIIPLQYRNERMKRLKEGIDFCNAAEIPAVHSHFGFIPENPGDPLYKEFIELMKELGEYALKQGIDIYFESGQETPVTLMRAIEDIGTGNLFVNYDTANMVLYGKSNPLDGLKVLSKYVKSFHAKDGFYPTNAMELGREVHIPNGLVDFPAIISYLKEIKFMGEIIIECELSNQNTDYIVQTKKYLEELIKSS